MLLLCTCFQDVDFDNLEIDEKLLFEELGLTQEEVCNSRTGKSPQGPYALLADKACLLLCCHCLCRVLSCDGQCVHEQG